MRSKLIPIFLGFLVSINVAGVLGQQSQANVPNRIAFISDIGGVPSIYVADPDHSDVNLRGILKLNNVPIPRHDLVFSPDRTKVLFVASSARPRTAALWIANTDGTGARKLIDWKWLVHSPFRAAWSPAGDRIAFVASTPDSYAIYLINPDGSNLRSVGIGDDFSWSPDGKQLVFTGFLYQQPGRFVYVVNINGTNLRQISSSRSAVQCRWSTDGKLIAVAEDRPETAPESRFNIFVIQPDGRGQKRVLENVPLYSDLVWSPRGELLSLVTKVEGSQGLYTWAAQANSQRSLRFFPGVAARFDWSPDGRQIVYGVDRVSLVDTETARTRVLFHTSGFGRPLWFPNGKRLLLQHTESIWRHTIQSSELDFWTTNLEPRFISRLTDESLVVTDLSSPPTGTRIAFAAATKMNNSWSNSVYVVNPDGSQMRKLPVTFIHSGWFAWSPDGTKIAFVKERSPTNYQIHVANADGSGEQILVDHPSWNFAPAWLPDGESIMFLSDRENGHAVYSVEVNSKRTRRVLDVSSSIHRHFVIGKRQPFIPVLWSPDVTKLAVQLEGSIIIIDITKPAGVVRYNGVAPSLQNWTPDSQRIVVADLPDHMGIALNSRPSYHSFEVYATDGNVSHPPYLTVSVSEIPSLQISRVAWRSDGERLAASDSSGGISVSSANGSDRRPILRGSQPIWVR